MNPFLHKQLALERTGYWGLGDLTVSSALTGAGKGYSAAGIATSIGTSLASTVGAGAAAGSFVPIIGTAIGVIVGLVLSGVFSHRQDPEVGNFDNAMAAYAQNPDNIYAISDKYLVLAGLFDLQPGSIKGNIPIYKKFGRMGEEPFTDAMMNRVYQAAQSGVITQADTPLTVMQKVVQPWIDSFGFGPMQDRNADMITRILTGMIAEYVTGLWKQRWFARGGDMPHWTFPTFSLPGGAGIAAGASGTPTQAAPAPSPAVQAATPQLTPAQQLAAQGYIPTGQIDPRYGPIYAKPGDPSRYVWYGSGVLSLGSSAPLAVSVPAPPTSSAVAIPTGFTVAGQSNNLPVYQGPDGNYYTWSGTTMSPFTGAVVLSNGTSLNIVGGIAPQAAPTSAVTSMFGPPGPSYPAPVLNSVVPSPAPTPVTAGVSGTGLPSWLTWGALGGLVLVLFATARPVGKAT